MQWVSGCFIKMHREEGQMVSAAPPPIQMKRTRVFKKVSIGEIYKENIFFLILLAYFSSN